MDEATATVDTEPDLAFTAVDDDPRLVQIEALRAGLDAQVAAEVAQVEAIRALAELYRASDPDEFAPLIERFVSSGRDGTPSVSEFLCLEIGPVLGVSPDVAAHRIWSVLDLVHRHPALHLAGCRVTVRPVIDHNRAPAVDCYEIPAGVRDAVISRTPIDAFPFGTRSARHCDLDHAHAHRTGGPPGQTRAANLTPLSRRAHRGKTACAWRYRMTEDGYHQWTSPLGLRYVSGPEGSTRHDSDLESRLQIMLHREFRAC